MTRPKDRPTIDERRDAGHPRRLEPRQKKGDATARVSEKPQPSQVGPDAKDVRSRKRTTDTRGAKGERAKAGTASETARRQPVRKPAAKQKRVRTTSGPTKSPKRTKKALDVPAPVQTIKVKGQPVQLVALAVKVDPSELSPVRRDTITKDALRHHGRAEEADAPVRRVQNADPLPPLEEVV